MTEPDPVDFLFEKMFFQAAHIAILEEAMSGIVTDLKRLAMVHKFDIGTELTKISIAYMSIDKLKKGIP